MFSALSVTVGEAAVLYPGSFVDISPSFVFRSVTYVDIDGRTPDFFADENGIKELISSHGASADAEFRFIHADYRDELPLSQGAFDLLVSLYAGFVSEHCTQYLRIGGMLVVAPSHGDAAMASIDPRYHLAGVVISQRSDYRIRTRDLDTYLVPKTPTEISPDMLHRRGKGIAYTKSPFAYLFRRIG